MDLEKRYKDSEGNECTIMQMVLREPEWAANRIQAGEDAINRLQNTSSNSDCVKCPCCDAPWNIRENDSCSCGAFIAKRS